MSCGVSINHLTLDEVDLGEYRTFLKLSPPLRGEADASCWSRRWPRKSSTSSSAITRGRTSRPSGCPSPRPHPAAIGLETWLSAGLRLVRSARFFATEAARRHVDAAGGNSGVGIGRAAWRVGAPADLVGRFDPDAPYVLDPANLHSRCRNTPFDSRPRMEGVVKLTLVAGEVVWEG